VAAKAAGERDALASVNLRGADIVPATSRDGKSCDGCINELCEVANPDGWRKFMFEEFDELWNK
jgi:hypothetical protein